MPIILAPEKYCNMKTKEKTKKKSVDEVLREIRDKVSFEIKDLTPKLLKAYLKKQKGLRPDFS
jgi:hypothetical protein